MNTLTTPDVIVVGAGPAGSSAAYLLASAGMRVLLIDQYAFPRNKLCGGLLSGRSHKIFAEIFDEPWDPAIDYISHGACVYYGQTFLNSVENYRPLYLTSRPVFDTYLVELAEKRGVHLLQKTPVSSIDPARNVVLLQNGKTLQADFIIGADGVLSRVTKSLYPTSLDKRHLGLGLEIEIPRETVARDVTMPEIYFGVANWGYGWVFPKAATLTVGLGGVWKYNPDMKHRFGAFLQDIFGTLPEIPIRGHYLPFRRYRRPPGKNAILLVGDAAGLVEPITGEGIAFAMQSGKFAAEAILEAAEQQNPSLAYHLYRRKYREIRKFFDQASLMSYLLFPKKMEALFTKVLQRSNLPLVKQMDLLADEFGYKETFQFILTKLGKYVVETITQKH